MLYIWSAGPTGSISPLRSAAEVAERGSARGVAERDQVLRGRTRTMITSGAATRTPRFTQAHGIVSAYRSGRTSPAAEHGAEDLQPQERAPHVGDAEQQDHDQDQQPGHHSARLTARKEAEH